jgi:hypothetical protein
MIKLYLSVVFKNKVYKETKFLIKPLPPKNNPDRATITLIGCLKIYDRLCPFPEALEQ